MWCLKMISEARPINITQAKPAELSDVARGESFEKALVSGVAGLIHLEGCPLPSPQVESVQGIQMGLCPLGLKRSQIRIKQQDFLQLQ